MANFCYCCDETPTVEQGRGVEFHVVVLCTTCYSRHRQRLDSAMVVGCSTDLDLGRVQWVGWSSPNNVSKLKAYFDNMCVPAPIGIPARVERPCVVCKRPNDVDVLTCWWCGELRPTRTS